MMAGEILYRLNLAGERVPLTPEEIAQRAIDAAPPPVDLAAYARQRQAEILAAGVDINVAGDGQPPKPILCDGTSATRADLALLVLEAQNDPAASTAWLDNDGGVTALSSAEMIALSTHTGAWIKGTYAAMIRVLAGLNATPPAYTTTAQVDTEFAAVPAR